MWVTTPWGEESVRTIPQACCDLFCLLPPPSHVSPCGFPLGRPTLFWTSLGAHRGQCEQHKNMPPTCPHSGCGTSWVTPSPFCSPPAVATSLFLPSPPLPSLPVLPPSAPLPFPPVLLPSCPHQHNTPAPGRPATGPGPPQVHLGPPPTSLAPPPAPHHPHPRSAATRHTPAVGPLSPSPQQRQQRRQPRRRRAGCGAPGRTWEGRSWRGGRRREGLWWSAVRAPGRPGLGSCTRCPAGRWRTAGGRAHLGEADRERGRQGWSNRAEKGGVVCRRVLMMAVQWHAKWGVGPGASEQPPLPSPMTLQLPPTNPLGWPSPASPSPALSPPLPLPLHLPQIALAPPLTRWTGPSAQRGLPAAPQQLLERPHRQAQQLPGLGAQGSCRVAQPTPPEPYNAKGGMRKAVGGGGKAKCENGSQECVVGFVFDEKHSALAMKSLHNNPPPLLPALAGTSP